MIKIDKNDSIVDVILKIKNCKDENVSLEFPFWHPILHNYTSLKILKTKVWKKDLIIFTNDKTSKRIWKKLWIKYNLVTKADVPETEYSFWEYFLYTMKNYFLELKNFLTNKARENSFSKYQKIYTNWKIWFFIVFLLFSIWLLIFIFYFAVNKTYIYITPEIENRPKWKNFVFEKMWEWELSLDKNIIRLKEIEKTVNLSVKIFTTGIDEADNTRSKWKVKIQNYTEEEIKLVKNTRLVTKEWIIFLLDDIISIPALWDDEKPGESIITATARINDINNKITWERWNIKSGEIMSLPGLKENNDKIIAVSIEDFNWWKKSTNRILSKEDLENSKNILRGKLEQMWIEEIKKEIYSENKVNNVKYEILWANGMIKFSNFTFSWIENLKVWDKINDFEIKWSIKTTAYAFNKETVMAKLRTDINDLLLKNVESIFNIDENSFSVVDEIWREENPFRIKATVQVDVWYTQNFLSNTNNYVEKLKYQIAWKSKQEAEKILTNTWKISNVNIDIRPFFIKNISNIPENIKFEIK